jgi:hypothetical protein
VPNDRRRAAGFDPELWYGLGIIGVWAAMDAYLERNGLSKGILSARFRAKGNARKHVLDKLDDLRNLFAHNFAGIADDFYLKRTRPRLNKNKPCDLTCGLHFSGAPGERVMLTLAHFRHYIATARDILANQ